MEEDNKTTKIAILVDGNNFYRGLEKSELLRTHSQLNGFNYDALAEFIAQKREIGAKKFYKGVIRKELGNLKSQRMVSEQQRLFARLEASTPKWDVVRGKLSKNPEFGKCDGFYFYKEAITKENIKDVSDGILQEHKLAYNPIVVISHDSPATPLEEVLRNCRENAGLRKIDGVYFAVNRWKEKGVDVNIAIDMMEMAYGFKNGSSHINTIVLVSSDSDLKPVIKRVQSFGISVEYVGLEYAYSISLLNINGIKRLLLTEEQLLGFLPQKLGI